MQLKYVEIKHQADSRSLITTVQSIPSPEEAKENKDPFAATAPVKSLDVERNRINKLDLTKTALPQGRPRSLSTNSTDSRSDFPAVHSADDMDTVHLKKSSSLIRQQEGVLNLKSSME